MSAACSASKALVSVDIGTGARGATFSHSMNPLSLILQSGWDPTLTSMLVNRFLRMVSTLGNRAWDR